MDTISIFSERLNELMIEHNITTIELSMQLGVSKETIRLWKNGKRYIFLSQLIRLADYFNCSINYLAGRDDSSFINIFPQNNISFYNRLREVMREKNITRYELVKNTHIYDSYFTNWKKGADVHILTLIELADYLDCSIDYLIGREG